MSWPPGTVPWRVPFTLGAARRRHGCRARARHEGGDNRRPGRKSEISRPSNEGTKLLRDGNIAEAQEKLERAISLDPSDGLAHYNYGVTLLLVNRLSEALEEFERAIDLNAGEPNAYYYPWSSSDSSG